MMSSASEGGSSGVVVAGIVFLRKEEGALLSVSLFLSFSL